PTRAARARLHRQRRSLADALVLVRIQILRARLADRVRELRERPLLDVQLASLPQPVVVPDLSAARADRDQPAKRPDLGELGLELRVLPRDDLALDPEV